jgi:hypothetical protein
MHLNEIDKITGNALTTAIIERDFCPLTIGDMDDNIEKYKHFEKKPVLFG